MKLKIERPNYKQFDSGNPRKDSEQFDLWWNDQVEPINKLLSEGFEVYAPDKDFNFAITKNVTNEDDYKALLINIQPIMRETAEDVLRDFVNANRDGTLNRAQLFELIDRAKQALAETEEE